MTKRKFISNLKDFYYRAILTSEKARREGLLALEDELEESSVKSYDLWSVGMRLVIDGTDAVDIRAICDNIIHNKKRSVWEIKYLEIQKNAILSIQAGDNPRILTLKILSCVPVESHKQVIMEEVLKC